MMAIRVLCDWLVVGEGVVEWLPLFETCKGTMEVVRMKHDILRVALNRAYRRLEQIPRDHIAQRLADGVAATATLRLVTAMMDACAIGPPCKRARNLEEAAAGAALAIERDIEDTDELTIAEEEKQLRRDGVLVAAGRIQDIAAVIQRMRLGKR